MKVTSTGIIILTSFLALRGGCEKGATPANVKKTDRLVTIKAGGSLGCEVDYPVAVVSKSQNYPRWLSADKEYWIHFTDPQSPFAPGIDPIHVPAHRKTPKIDVTGDPNYYKYEIWNQFNSAANTHNTCKAADDDHDTGLNIKP